MGSISLAKGLLISKKQAIELCVSRFCGSNDEENLKLPAVKDRLNQRNWGITGIIFLVMGLVLQLMSLSY